MVLLKNAFERVHGVTAGFFRRTGKTKFIADAMLGRLARWLRILGYDVLYYPDIEDRQVIRIAREQERTILTRDTGLASRKAAADVIFITGDNVLDQLRQLSAGLRSEDALSQGRCAVCNGVLSVVENKGEIRDAVPDFVYVSHHDFLRCVGCGKTYWRGSHLDRFRERIGNVLKVGHED